MTSEPLSPGAGTGSSGSTRLDGPVDRRRAIGEVWLVLGLSLLPAAATAVVAIIDRLTRDAALGEQTTTLNQAASQRWVFDLLYRSISITAGMVVVLLAIWLLSTRRMGGGARIGLDGRRVGRDLLTGLGLAACIGVPGLGLYLGARATGLAPQVQANADELTGATIAILVLAALRAALVEEVVVVGYLMTRLRDLGWSGRRMLAASAVLRGSYHLYQGPAMALGNVAMGLLCGAWFRRTGRVAPLVVAHFLLDLVSFTGYALATAWWPGLF